MAPRGASPWIDLSSIQVLYSEGSHNYLALQTF
jgi:hypothetical protein